MDFAFINPYEINNILLGNGAIANKKVPNRYPYLVFSKYFLSFSKLLFLWSFIAFLPIVLNCNSIKRPITAAVAPTIDNKNGFSWLSNEYAETTTIHVGGVNIGIILNTKIKKNTNGYVYSENKVMKKSYNNISKYTSNLSI